MITRASDIAEWMRQQVTIANARGLVVGLTGGLESAVAARLCEAAAPGRVICAITTGHGDPGSQEDAQSVARHFDLPVVRLDLTPPYDHLAGDLQATVRQLRADGVLGAAGESSGPDARMPMVNLEPRLRTAALYFLAESFNCLVVGAGTRSELTIGSFAKYSDSAVDLLPLGRLLDSEVRALAIELDVPESIIESARADRLGTRTVDEGQMGFSYADLERYLTAGPDGVSPALAMRIERLVRTSEHKRAPALIPAD
jgi:NAD+ synthase